MGYSPWGYKQSDGSGMTEHTHLHILLYLKAAYALVAGVQKGFQRGAACLSEKVKAQPTQGVELMERKGLKMMDIIGFPYLLQHCGWEAHYFK